MGRSPKKGPYVDGRVLPGLAFSWEASDNARRWRLGLRGGVVFHTGRPFTAREVKRTFEAALLAEVPPVSTTIRPA